MYARSRSKIVVGVAVAGALVASAESATQVTAVFGEAVINPVESNIAAKPWASAAASSGGASAGLAIDQDEATAWVAEGAVAGQWLSLDLGGMYDNIRKVEVVFADPAATYQYEIEVSGDGAAWESVLDASSNLEPSNGTMALLTRSGTRYVRVAFSDASAGAVIGVAEIRAFNYLRDDLILGADLSYTDQRTTVDQDQFGAQFWSHPTGPLPECCEGWGGGPHVLDMVQEMGMEYIRLRIWNEPRFEGWEPGNPPSGTPFPIPYQGPERSKEVAKWIKAERGMGLGIDFHYSDSWADPSKQPKPRAWAELEFDDLDDAVYDFTRDYIQQLIDQGTTPDKVAVGNEIINGFLYGSEASIIGTTNPAYFVDQAEIYQSQPGGGLLWTYWNSSDPQEQALYDEQWDRFSTLVASGIEAVRDVSDANGEDIEVEIHVIIDNNRLAKTLEFWNQLLSRLATKGQTVDVLAHSYYPQWHGTPEHYESNINAVAAAHPGHKIDIAETSYPAAGGGGAPLPNSPYPRTIQGQADAIQRVFSIANDLPDNRGVGVLMWEPLNWEEMVNWDAWPVVQPNASMDVFNKSHATHVVQGRVYRSVAVGDPLILPATVRVLTTADGSVADVPVEWDAVPDGATDAPGELAVSGSTEFGDVTALVSVVEALRGDPGGPADGTQELIATLEADAGALVISVDPDDRTVVFPPFELAADGESWVTAGDLRPVTVTDTRPGSPGWVASGQSSDFTSLGGDVFTGAYLGWTPDIVSQPVGAGVVAGPTVAPGFPTGDGLSRSRTLASAGAGDGRGTTVLGGGLALQVDTGIEPGVYAATVTFTAL
ncbi:MAG TPA: glycosyl hydrolase 53 family protein [Ilumatobacteraceae bacterium]|nr:glycosyl hydrolase 53 family protein [Ilumatobacteraceae bacterium]